MGAFRADVALRWSDMDAYGHVNNARVVTLLEEARTALLWGDDARRGEQLFDSVVVVELTVRYWLPLVYAARPVPVRLWVSELRNASFTLDYAISDTEGNGDAVTARTRLASYEVETRRPRRLSTVQREFLASFQNTGFQNTGFQNTGFQNTGFQNTGFMGTACGYPVRGNGGDIGA